MMRLVSAVGLPLPPPAHVQARYGMRRLMLAATALGCSSARQATTSAMCLQG